MTNYVCMRFSLDLVCKIKTPTPRISHQKVTFAQVSGRRDIVENCVTYELFSTGTEFTVRA